MENDKKRICVIGAGAAGLAAAFQLQRRGFQVTLLESEAVVGGKLRTKYRDGYTLDQGAFFIPTTHKRMVALASEAGFGKLLEPGGTTMAAYRNGEIHSFSVDHIIRDLLRTRYLSGKTKLSLLGLAGELRRCGETAFSRIATGGRFDQETVADWAERAVSPEIAEYVVDLVMRGMAGASAKNSPRIEFMGLLHLLKGAKLVACRGGMGAYASQLSRGCEFISGASTESVRHFGESVEIQWRDEGGDAHNLQCDGAIVATPAPVVSTLVHSLDDWRRQYLGSTPDKKSIIVNIALSEPPADFQAAYILLPQAAHPFICGICADHHKALGRVPEGKGLLTVMLSYEWSIEHIGDSDDDLIQQVLPGVEGIIPGTCERLEFAEVVRWSQRYNPPGHYRELDHFRALCEGDGRVQLAGDYFGYANLESAICAGEAAAQRLNRIVRGA